jgi:hypothetical protein
MDLQQVKKLMDFLHFGHVGCLAGIGDRGI